tara:strand:+ start:711 stop:1376 length:666 start_codon:yes stop_codon:yes gene_type:complete
MISSRKLLKLFVLLLTASTLFNPANAVTGNGKRQEKLAKYKTPQLVYFVDTVVSYLEKNKDINPRHLTLLKKCQKTLNSNKKRLIGMEVVNIKSCKNLSTSGIYNVKYTDLNSNRINIFDNNEKIQNPLNRNDEYFDEREADNLKNQIEMQLKEQELKEFEEFKEKQLKEQKELKEKQLKEQKVKELEEMLEELKKKQLKEQKEKESRESNIKDKTNLLFD